MAKKKNLKTKITSAFFLLIIVLLGSVLGVYYSIKNLNYGLDLQGGFEVLYEVNSIDKSKVTNEMVDSTYRIIDKRINALGVSEPEIAIEGNNIRVTMAGVDNIDEARKTISTTAALSFRTIDGELLMTSDVLNSGKASVQYDANRGYVIALSVKDYDEFYKQTKKVSEMESKYIVIWLDYEEEYKLTNSGRGYAYTTNETITNEDGTESTVQTLHECGDLKNSNCLSVAGVNQGFASDVIIEGNFELEEAQG